MPKTKEGQQKKEKILKEADELTKIISDSRKVSPEKLREPMTI